MSERNLLSTEFDFEEMIKILKSSTEQFPICQSIAKLLCDMIEVAIIKLDLLIKFNQDIDDLIENGSIDDKIQNLDALCTRSQELYEEIENLPIMQENSLVLSELLGIPTTGKKYSELLALIYHNKELIYPHNNPLHGLTLIHHI